jgi:cytochrome c551/c552
LIAGHRGNHSLAASEDGNRNQPAFPQLTGRELTDVLTYVRTMAPTGNAMADLSLTASGSGLFQSKGCAGCHKEGASLEKGFGHRTMADFAAAMWNHAPLMRQAPPPLTTGDMQEIIGYLWSTQYFVQRGDAKAGKKIFQAKNCEVCDDDPSSGATKLAGTPRRAYTTVTRSLAARPNHPFANAREKHSLPRFRGTEMADQVAYLTELK